MRIIDADALARKWQDVLNTKADEKGTVAYITFELFLERLAQEPTLTLDDIIPHGRWVHNENGEVRCGRCNALLGVGSNLPEIVEDINYCPNCGAKMLNDNPELIGGTE